MKWCKVDNNSVSLKDKSLILGHRHCTSLPLQVEDEDYASDSRNAPIALTAGRKNAPRYQNFMVADSSNIPAFNLLCQRISVDFPHVFLYLARVYSEVESHFGDELASDILLAGALTCLSQ